MGYAELWEKFWDVNHIPDETFIAPGYVGADQIAKFAAECCATLTAELAAVKAELKVTRTGYDLAISAAVSEQKERLTVEAELSAVEAERDMLLDIDSSTGAFVRLRTLREKEKAELAAVKAERDALLGAAINMLKAHMQPLANRPERIANAVRELDAAFVRLYGTDHAKAALAAVEGEQPTTAPMTPAEIDRALADELGWSAGETEMEDSDSISGRSRQKVYLTIEGTAVRWGNLQESMSMGQVKETE